MKVINSLNWIKIVLIILSLSLTLCNFQGERKFHDQNNEKNIIKDGKHKARKLKSSVSSKYKINMNVKSNKRNNNIMFAPYVDITLYPTFDLTEALTLHGVDTLIISFIVSCSVGYCTQNGASFAGIIGVGDPDITGSLKVIDDSIKNFKDKGGKIIISFGGAINDELALHHDTPESLAREYKKVIEAYQPIRIDFDLEGTGLMDMTFTGKKMKEVHQLRAKALNLLKNELQDKMPEISLCLPVNPDIGFDERALSVIEAMKNENVPLTMVSIMAMDYGANYIGRGSYNNAIQSLEKSYEQSRLYYPEIKMGVIPMIGVNDDGSIFTFKDAERLISYIKNKEWIGMLSMWSINRDKNDGKFTSLITNTYTKPITGKDKRKKAPYQYTLIFKKYF